MATTNASVYHLVGSRVRTDDLQYGTRDTQHVGLESRVTHSLQAQVEVRLDCKGNQSLSVRHCRRRTRVLRNISDQADHHETPKCRIGPRLLDILPLDGVLDRRQALGGIVSQDSLYLESAMSKAGSHDVR